MNIDKKKAILAFLEKNPGSSVIQINAGLPEWTLRKLVNQLAEEKMIVKIGQGWKLASGTDLLGETLERPDQIAERYIRNMIRVSE